MKSQQIAPFGQDDASAFNATPTNPVSRPESGAATARFLVLQHERRRRAALGPCAADTAANALTTRTTRTATATAPQPSDDPSNSVVRHAAGQANTSVQHVHIGRIEW
jgi:hypothetical protein